MSKPTEGWNPAKQRRLISQLRGFWAADSWDMHHSPIAEISPRARQRHLHFNCGSPSINGELKYVFWKKYAQGCWTSTQELSKIHRLVKWLNTLKRLPASLMARDFDAWRTLYTAYLKKQGIYSPGTTTCMDGEQRLRVTPREARI